MLTRYDPWASMHHLHDEINRVFGHKPVDGEDNASVVKGRWTPAVDIKELDDKFVIAADLPGINPEEIEITTDNGILSIKGERKHEKSAGDDADDKTGYRRVERSYGSFYRRFTLPETADVAGISASGSHGVLEVSIPKKIADLPKRIKVLTQAA